MIATPAVSGLCKIAKLMAETRAEFHCAAFGSPPSRDDETEYDFDYYTNGIYAIWDVMRESAAEAGIPFHLDRVQFTLARRVFDDYFFEPLPDHPAASMERTLRDIEIELSCQIPDERRTGLVRIETELRNLHAAITRQN
jgi:hypothetical protein